jgi:hypothetical protein
MKVAVLHLFDKQKFMVKEESAAVNAVPEKKELRKTITEKITAALSEYAAQTDKDRFDKKIKKAAKLLAEALEETEKKQTAKKVKAAKPAAKKAVSKKTAAKKKTTK